MINPIYSIDIFIIL